MDLFFSNYFIKSEFKGELIMDKGTLARYDSDSYMSEINDTLYELEWYIDCKDMKITVEGEKLPTQKFEGIGNCRSDKFRFI